MTARKRPVRAVLLAAGKGTRMKSAKPKVMHEVLGKPIIGRVVDAAEAAGVSHVHVVVGHEAEQVEGYLAERQAKEPDVSLSTHLQEPQLGTGHALMQVVPALAGWSGDLLVSVGDAPLLSAATLRALIDEHERSGAVVTLLSTEVDEPGGYGRVLRNDKGDVVGVVEAKDATPAQLLVKEVNTAIYCFSWPEIEAGLAGLTNENKQGEYYLPDLVAWAVKSGRKLSAVKTDDWGEVSGINSRLELAEVSRHLRDRTIERLALESGVTVLDPASTWIAPEVKIGQDTTVMPGCQIFGDVEIGSGCVIGPEATIKGAVKVGDNCTVLKSVILDSTIGDSCRIGPFSHVREGNELGDFVRVGNFVELKKCKVASHTNVSHLSYVGDTTVGSNANIGAGTITANYDHLTRVKSRTVIGDGASTGSNSVLVAPVTLGAEAVVAAGTVVTRDVPDGALAVGRARQENKEGWSARRKSRRQVSISS